MKRKTLFWRTAGIWILGWIPVSVVAEEMAGVNLDINIDYSNDPFYTELWFLILIALLLLLLLVQLIRGGRKSRRRQKKASSDGTKKSVSVENQSDHPGEED